MSFKRGRFLQRAGLAHFLAPLAVVAGSCLMPGGLAAQANTAVVSGEVVDVAGRPIPAAEVRLTQVATGNVRRTLTNQAGRYQLVNVPPGGPYRILVRSLGYADGERDEITLAEGERLEAAFELTATPIELEGLIATGLADQRFNPLRNAPSLILNRVEIRTHPTIQRSFLELARLSPVTVQTRDEGGYSITGQPERQNAVLIDGELFQDVFGASPVGNPGARARAKPLPMAALEEFHLEVAPFDARSTGFTGGLMNAVTRSGGEVWEGSAFGNFRNERFFGDLFLDGASMAPARYERRLVGFTLGGPLRPDGMRLFMAGEFENRTEPPVGFSLGTHDPIATRVAADSAVRVGQILQETYGLDAGTHGEVDLRNPISNVFTRLDLRPGNRHELKLQHNFAYAARDTTPNRAAFGAYEFSSAGYRVSSTTHSLSGQLISRWDQGHSNEVTFNFVRTNERAMPESAFPQIDVRVASELDGNQMVRDLRAGSRYFQQHDALKQTVLQLHDVVTLVRGDVLTTFGAGLDYFRFEHDYLPGSGGYYRFDSLEDLQANRASHYETNALIPGVNDPAVRFAVIQPAVFFQNNHTFQDGLVLRYGMRIEVPTFLKDVAYADAVFDEFDFDRPRRDRHFPNELLLLGGGVAGFATDVLPSGKPLFSPRFGFNWQSDRSYRTQVRGGWGVFTGRIPFVWLSNVYRYNGLSRLLLACRGSNAPGLDPASPAPQQCVDGRDLEEAGEMAVVGFHPRFTYPREIKVSTSIDQELPGGVVASVEALFVQTEGRTRLAELNLLPLDDIADEDYLEVFGPRIRYGPAEPLGYRPGRRVDGFSNVLMMFNDSRSAIAYSVVANVEKRFGNWLHLNAAYTTARSDDVQSLLFPDHVMNFASTPIDFLPNAPGPGRSAFDRPWKWTASGRLQLPRRWGGADVTLTYVGQAGMPYSYVYGTDVNGDGYSGVGIPLDASNDLLYVPDPPGSLSGSPLARSLFARLVEMEPCLDEARGDFHRRNSCRGPGTHRVDLRVAQPVHIRGLRFEVNADILNVGNLVNSDWGLVWEVPPTVPVLDVVGRQDPRSPGFTYGRALLGYSGRVHRDPETGELEPRLPHNLVVPASQWQAQVGLRVSF